MKPTVIDPKLTTRASAFDLWMHAPNPMVTFFKTMDVTPLVRLSRKRDKRGGFSRLAGNHLRSGRIQGDLNGIGKAGA